MALVYIGIGSNLGDRYSNIENAKEILIISCPAEILSESEIEETEPVDLLEQPKFLNQIILIETDKEPLALLKILQQIELKIGPRKTVPKGPRVIDLDILLYNDIILNLPDLTIPHPEIKNRSFVLKHLTDIAPDLIDPITGIPYRKY